MAPHRLRTKCLTPPEATVRYGRLRLWGVEERPLSANVYLRESAEAVRVLGSEGAFASGTGLERVREGRLSVRFVEPEDAPRELAAYVGHQAVVVAGAVTAVPADWTRGLEVKEGFLSARAYREWGEVAVVPTRARLEVRREGGELRVRNALGAALEGGYVRVGGELWEVPALADGAEGVATVAPEKLETSARKALRHFPAVVGKRFEGVPWERWGEPLPEGDFVVELGGVGPGPLSALPVKLHEGVHLVHGRVDGP